LFEKQENVLIRALICGPKSPVWVAGKSSRISTLQAIFWFEKQENVLIRALICGPKSPFWVAGLVPALDSRITICPTN
jgi:hypothetical protein